MVTLGFHNPTALTTFTNFAPKFLQIITPFKHPLEQLLSLSDLGSLWLIVCSCGAPPSPLSFVSLLVREIGTELDSWLSLAEASDSTPTSHLLPEMLGNQMRPHDSRQGGAWIGEGLMKVTTYSPEPQLWGSWPEVGCPASCDLGDLNRKGA